MKDVGFLLGELVRFQQTATNLLFELWDVELGIWLTLAQANIQDEAMAQGIPVLRGPYVVDYTDIPHDGDKKTLWTPAVGDVLLRLFTDVQTHTFWDHGTLFVGQDVDGTLTPAHNVIASGGNGTGGGYAIVPLDTSVQPLSSYYFDNVGTPWLSTAYVAHSTDPVQIQLAQTGGTNPTTGHLELYALVARAVAP
jgi:hypothetical protein